MPGQKDSSRQKRRLARQFAVIERRFPAARRPMGLLRRDGLWLLRIPLALLLIVGGIFSVLPFLGLWMLPLGLLLLAIDVPALRPGISALVIRARRWGTERLRAWRAWRDRR